MTVIGADAARFSRATGSGRSADPPWDHSSMSWASAQARAVRRLVFEVFARERRPPSPAELGGALELDPDTVAGALRELHDAHAIVLTTTGDAIRMAHPFSAWPMGFVVRGPGDRLWWGGCAWDSFGIIAALGEPLEILTRCPATGEDLRYAAAPDSPPRPVARSQELLRGLGLDGEFWALPA